jgi:hypothetical protein
MPSKLLDNIKSLVIQNWLTGDATDKIAIDAHISACAVSKQTNGE